MFVIGTPSNSSFSSGLSEFGSELSDFGTVWSAGRGSVVSSVAAVESELLPVEAAFPEITVPLLVVGGVVSAGVGLYQWLTRKPGTVAGPQKPVNNSNSPIVGGVALLEPVVPEWFPRPIPQRRQR